MEVANDEEANAHKSRYCYVLLSAILVFTISYVVELTDLEVESHSLLFVGVNYLMKYQHSSRGQ